MEFEISEDEKNTLNLLNENENVVTEFCKLSIEYLDSDLNPKIFTSAGKKLNVNPSKVQNALQALLSIFIKSTERNISREEFILRFKQIFTPNIINNLATFYEENKYLFIKNIEELQVKVPEYKDMQWRFDILTGTKSLRDIVEPQITMQLKLHDKEKNEVQDHYMQMDPSMLFHMTESLEEATIQARTNRIRRLRKKKLASQKK